MEEVITITRSDLEQALRHWDQAADEGDWQDRADDARFADSAKFLFDFLKTYA